MSSGGPVEYDSRETQQALSGEEVLLFQCTVILSYCLNVSKSERSDKAPRLDIRKSFVKTLPVVVRTGTDIASIAGLK